MRRSFPVAAFRSDVLPLKCLLWGSNTTRASGRAPNSDPTDPSCWVEHSGSGSGMNASSSGGSQAGTAPVTFVLSVPMASTAAPRGGRRGFGYPAAEAARSA